MTLSETPINESAMSFEYDVLSDRWICAPDLKAMYGVPHGAEMTTDYMAGRMVHDDRDLMLERFAFHLSNPGPFQYEFRIHDHANRVRHLVLVGNSEGAGDEVKRMSGYLVDITESLREQTTAAVAASA
ncbi:hypothetical protein WU91_26085, partial [Salmonella enterica]|nr:hypothetical protein [Salmonella enterica]